VHLCLSVLLTVISLVVFICTVTYELINDDDDISGTQLSSIVNRQTALENATIAPVHVLKLVNFGLPTVKNSTRVSTYPKSRLWAPISRYLVKKRAMPPENFT